MDMLDALDIQRQNVARCYQNKSVNMEVQGGTHWNSVPLALRWACCMVDILKSEGGWYKADLACDTQSAGTLTKGSHRNGLHGRKCSEGNKDLDQ